MAPPMSLAASSSTVQVLLPNASASTTAYANATTGSISLPTARPKLRYQKKTFLVLMPLAMMTVLDIASFELLEPFGEEGAKDNSTAGGHAGHGNTTNEATNQTAFLHTRDIQDDSTPNQLQARWNWKTPVHTTFKWAFPIGGGILGILSIPKWVENFRHHHPRLANTTDGAVNGTQPQPSHESNNSTTQQLRRRWSPSKPILRWLQNFVPEEDPKHSADWARWKKEILKKWGPWYGGGVLGYLSYSGAKDKGFIYCKFYPKRCLDRQGVPANYTGKEIITRRSARFTPTQLQRPAWDQKDERSLETVKPKVKKWGPHYGLLALGLGSFYLAKNKLLNNCKHHPEKCPGRQSAGANETKPQAARRSDVQGNSTGNDLQARAPPIPFFVWPNPLFLGVVIALGAAVTLGLAFGLRHTHSAKDAIERGKKKHEQERIDKIDQKEREKWRKQHPPGLKRRNDGGEVDHDHDNHDDHHKAVVPILFDLGWLLSSGNHGALAGQLHIGVDDDGYLDIHAEETGLHFHGLVSRIDHTTPDGIAVGNLTINLPGVNNTTETGHWYSVHPELVCSRSINAFAELFANRTSDDKNDFNLSVDIDMMTRHFTALFGH